MYKNPTIFKPLYYNKRVEDYHCVYTNAEKTGFEVRVLSSYFGWFENIEVAAYVANIGIIINETSYFSKLNNINFERIDHNELLEWRLDDHTSKSIEKKTYQIFSNHLIAEHKISGGIENLNFEKLKTKVLENRKNELTNNANKILKYKKNLLKILSNHTSSQKVKFQRCECDILFLEYLSNQSIDKNKISKILHDKKFKKIKFDESVINLANSLLDVLNKNMESKYTKSIKFINIFTQILKTRIEYIIFNDQSKVKEFRIKEEHIKSIQTLDDFKKNTQYNFFYLYDYIPRRFNKKDIHSNLILDFKNGKKEAIKFFGGILNEIINDSILIFAIPSSKRGISPSMQLLNDFFLKNTNKKIHFNLRRRLDIEKKVGLTDRDNFQKYFERERSSTIFYKDKNFEGKKAIFLDDVSTTGISLMSAALTARENGIIHPIGFVFGKTKLINNR